MLYLNISQRIPDQKLKSEIMYFLTELKNFLSTGLHKSRKQFFYFFLLVRIFFGLCMVKQSIFNRTTFLFSTDESKFKGFSFFNRKEILMTNSFFKLCSEH